MFLQIKGLSKSFGALKAVSDVNMEVEEGERVAVIGPNGAGKTTFFNLLTGYLAPDSGEVTFKGRDITRLAPDRIVRRKVGRSFQIVNIYPEMSVFESIRMTLIASRQKSYRLFSSARKLFHGETGEILRKVGLAELADATGELLSHGDKKRLEIAMILATQSELILLDEPTAGMAPEEKSSTMALINELADREKLTLLFTEHDMSVVFSWAKRIAVMVLGRIIADGTPQEIRENSEVRKVYLGER